MFGITKTNYSEYLPINIEEKNRVVNLVQQNGNLLTTVDKSWLSNKEVVLYAIDNDPDAFKYADDSLKNDETFIFNAMIRRIFNESCIKVINVSWKVFKYADESLKKDKEFILKIITRGCNGNVFQYADESLKKDKEFILNLIKSSKQYYSSSRLEDKTDDWNFLEFIDASLKKDEEFILQAIKGGSIILPYVYFPLMKNKEFVLKTIEKKHDNVLTYIHSSLKKDKDIFYRALEHGWSVMFLFFLQINL